MECSGMGVQWNESGVDRRASSWVWFEDSEVQSVGEFGWSEVYYLVPLALDLVLVVVLLHSSFLLF